MKIWHLAALISGAIITTVMAFASLSYSATLSTAEPLFAWLPIPNTFIFGAMALAFDLGMIALDRCTDFQRRVLIAEYNIPRGRVSTYGRIAAHLGHPRASRAVGRVLATHPFPIVIPCHRAVQSDGRLGGYQGGHDMKRILLEMEGVRISTHGKVETDVFYY